MKLYDDIRTLVAQAKAAGRSALTVSMYQRLNLFHDPCKGWFLTCMPMPDFSELSRELDKQREFHVMFAATEVEVAIQALGEEGGFGEPCCVTTPGGDIYALQWSSRPKRSAPPPVSP